MTLKLGPFLLVSLALHAAALSYLMLLSRSAQEELVPVVVLGSEEGNGPLGSAGRREEPGHAAGRKRSAAVRQASPESADTALPAMANLSFIPLSMPDVSAGVEVAANRTSPSDSTEAMAISSANPGAVTDGGGGGAGNISGVGAGSGNGWGVGSGGEGARFAQPGYAYNPKPQYPERARKEGWEGTVIVRVLVDQEGKSKSLEVNRSSGFQALDDAAVRALRQWRFVPARYGARAVESWVRIPIVFRLADLKD